MDQKPKTIAQTIAGSKKDIEALNLPVPTFFALHIENGWFNAVEIDNYRRVYVFENVHVDPLQWLINFEKTRNKQIVAVGLGQRHKHSQLTTDLWLKYDIVPHIIQQKSHNTIEELIQSARLTASLFKPDLSVYPLLYDYNRVIPSYLVNKKAYQASVSPQLWKKLLNQAKEFKGKKIRFFSATPQGGGVALMRHALKRLFRLIDVDMTWHVLYDDPEVFKITKNKFHNVLQNVAKPGTKLSPEDKKLFRQWSAFNAEQFKPKIKKADVIVIDDPQPSGLVPFIQQWNPNASILYRSHIQLESHLINQKGTPQHTTWEFIAKFIQPAQVFIAHPIKDFIPQNIDTQKTVLMPATTDPLDGLNKPLTDNQIHYYINLFNQHLIETEQASLDLDREYLIQIARFDPSKGIPDLLEAYRLLCQQLPKTKRPQLVVTGHGSIDDPDGIPIYNYIRNKLNSKKFKNIKDDIKVARLPHVDQPLNALLRKAKIAMQLSHKEGFEIKVTESLMKGVPVVAYSAGGIPLQIDHGKNGFLVQVGDVKTVAQTLEKLITKKTYYQKICSKVESYDYSQYQTIMNATCWLYLANKCLQDNQFFGCGKPVHDLI